LFCSDSSFGSSGSSTAAAVRKQIEPRLAELEKAAPEPSGLELSGFGPSSSSANGIRHWQQTAIWSMISRTPKNFYSQRQRCEPSTSDHSPFDRLKAPLLARDPELVERAGRGAGSRGYKSRVFLERGGVPTTMMDADRLQARCDGPRERACCCTKADAISRRAKKVRRTRRGKAETSNHKQPLVSAFSAQLSLRGACVSEWIRETANRGALPGLRCAKKPEHGRDARATPRHTGGSPCHARSMPHPARTLPPLSWPP